MYLKVHPENPQGRHIAHAVDVLRDGGIIIYPTDTVYGLGCSIYNTHAIERVYRLKGQVRTKPFSFLCSDLSHISEFAKVSNVAFRLMKRLIPGPFTFLLPASRLKQLPKSLISKRKTVGIRVPDNKICRELVKELGHPVLNASLGNSREEILNDPEVIRSAYEERTDLILAGGNSAMDFSTVIDLTDDQPSIVRQGAGEVPELTVAAESA